MVRPEPDSVRLVSSQLVPCGGFRRLGRPLQHLFENFRAGLQAVENYMGHFLEQLQKIWKKYKQLPAKGAREARPFVAEAICCTFSIFFAIFPKNGPGSFPHFTCSDLDAAEPARLSLRKEPWFRQFDKRTQS